MRRQEPATGSAARVEFAKYDGTAHWSFDAVFLAADEHGTWLGGRPGGMFARPGMRFVGDAHWVLLVSRERPFVCTRYARGHSDGVEFYADLTTVPTISVRPDGVLVVRAIDLDLDVVRRSSETQAWIDDEDEFAEHRVSMGYPQHLAEATRQEAVRLREELTDLVEPFGGLSRSHLARIQQVTGNETMPQAQT